MTIETQATRDKLTNAILTAFPDMVFEDVRVVIDHETGDIIVIAGNGTYSVRAVNLRWQLKLLHAAHHPRANGYPCELEA